MSPVRNLGNKSGETSVMVVVVVLKSGPREKDALPGSEKAVNTA